MTPTKPASNYDIACCVGKCQPILWSALKAQRDASETWSLRDEQEEAFLVAGLWLREDGVLEAWFLVREDAAKHLPSIVKAIRLTIERSSYDRIECRIATNAGARIARLCGFQRFETINGVETWRWGSCLAEATTEQ